MSRERRVTARRMATPAAAADGNPSAAAAAEGPHPESTRPTMSRRSRGDSSAKASRYRCAVSSETTDANGDGIALGTSSSSGAERGVRVPLRTSSRIRWITLWRRYASKAPGRSASNIGNRRKAWRATSCNRSRVSHWVRRFVGRRPCAHRLTRGRQRASTRSTAAPSPCRARRMSSHVVSGSDARVTLRREARGAAGFMTSYLRKGA